MTRYLIDTHTWLWSLEDDPRLSRTAREALVNEDADLVFSVASVWEICIKAGIGKLRLPDAPSRFIPQHLALNRIRVLPVELKHALEVFGLPFHHHDPFDRLLIGQALTENLSILTADPGFSLYGVKVVW